MGDIFGIGLPRHDFVVGLARCNEPHEILVETLDAIDTSVARPSRVIIVDNGDAQMSADFAIDRQLELTRPDHNLGCAGAWNRIYQLSGGRSRTVIINADCAVGIDTFQRMLAVPPPAVVLAYGFGCFLIDAEVYERVGPFDEDFYPVYFEDTDYRRRMKLAGITPIEWPIDLVEVIRPGRERVASGITHGSWDPDGYQGWRGDRLAWFRERYEDNKRRYAAKWGGDPGEETFATPFGV